MGDNYKLRINTWKHTKEIAHTYPFPGNAIKYKYVHTHVYNTHRFSKVQYKVLPYDTLDVAKAFIFRGYYDPLILNMADDCFPGGSVDMGSGAQEESIFRRTNLHVSLDIKKQYPIKQDEAIYSPNITCFKENELREFRLYDEPFKVDIVSCPGIRIPQLTEDGHLTEEHERILKIKIECICQIAEKHKKNMLILGALGCGAWRNPPRDVARIFKEVLQKVHGCFRLVVFAILPNTQKGYIIKNHDANEHTIFNVFNEVFTSM